VKHKGSHHKQSWTNWRNGHYPETGRSDRLKVSGSNNRESKCRESRRISPTLESYAELTGSGDRDAFLTGILTVISSVKIFNAMTESTSESKLKTRAGVAPSAFGA